MIPSHLFTALGVGVFIYAATQMAGYYFRMAAVNRNLVLVPFVLIPLSMLNSSYRSVDRSQDRSCYNEAANILNAVDLNANIFTGWQLAGALIYLQREFTIRQDVTVSIVKAGGYGEIDTPLFSGQPVYFWGIKPADSQFKYYGFSQLNKESSSPGRKLYIAEQPKSMKRDNIVWEQARLLIGQGSGTEADLFASSAAEEWLLHPYEALGMAEFNLPFKQTHKIKSLRIGKAGTDISSADSRIIIELQNEKTEWICVDEINDTNIGLNIGDVRMLNYSKELTLIFPAEAIKFNFIGRGWFRLAQVSISCAGDNDKQNNMYFISMNDIKWDEADWLMGEDSEISADIFNLDDEQGWLLSPCGYLHGIELILPFDREYKIKSVEIERAGSEKSAQSNRIRIYLNHTTSGWILAEALSGENIGWNVDGRWRPKYFKCFTKEIPSKAVRIDIWGESWFRLKNLQLKYIN